MATNKNKLALAKIKADEKLSLKQFGTSKQRFSQLLRQPQIAPMLSKEQEMMQELFGGSPSWGSGEQLPVINNSLNSGHGLINSGDDYRETAGLFGI